MPSTATVALLFAALGLGFFGSELARQGTGWSARPVPREDEVVLVGAADEILLGDRQLVQCPPEVERPPLDCETADVGPGVRQGLAGCPLLVWLLAKSVRGIASRRLSRRPRREYVARRVQAARAGPAAPG